MVVWIVIAVVVIALAVIAFRPRKPGTYTDKAVRDAQGRGNPDLYDGRPPY